MSDSDFYTGILLEPYAGSHTWFEAVIVRDCIHEHAASGSNCAEPDSEIELIQRTAAKVVTDKNLDTWLIQRNERASSDFKLHTISWTKEEEADVDEEVLMCETGRGLGRGFVRSLNMNDRISILARAQVSLCLFDSRL